MTNIGYDAQLDKPFGAVLPAETREQAEQERDRLQALQAKAD